MVASNTYGRQVVLPLTNKSGGGVVLGDVVVVDTTNNDAFTTTTSANFTGLVGIAQETIANNATGRVLISGYASLVNVNASVTRGHFGATYTVAKQATDAAASRQIGTFCQFLTGGTTPDANVFNPDLGGAGLTNPMTTTGDIIYSADNSGTPARLAAVAAGKLLKSAGTGTAPAWGYPAFHGCKVYNSTTQSVSSTSAALTFDSEEYDTDAFHSTVSATSKITIPSGLDGYYLLQGGTFGDNTWSWIGFKKGGNALRGYGGTVSGGAHYATSSAIILLAAADYVELWVNTTSAANMGHATLLDAQSWFAATLLGV